MRTAVFLFLAACSFETRIVPSGGDALAIPDAPPGAWLTGYGYRKAIVVNRAGTTTLASFPVGIVIDDRDLLAHARIDGRDIVVTGGDAMTPLDFELASYDAGALEMWTRVPSLPVGKTILYIYYGGPVATANAANVWPAPQFKGVWHLSDPSTATGAADSTAANHDLAAISSPAHLAGRAGLAREHDGLDDGLEIADPSDGSLDVGMQSFAYSIWIKSTAMVGQFDNPFFRGGTSTSNPGFCIMTGTGGWQAKLQDTAGYHEISFTTTPLLGQWLHLTAVVDRTAGTATTYLNGALVATRTLAVGSLDTQRELRFGFGSGGSQFSGITDEARIYNTALTAEWIATEYANLATSGFLQTGDEEKQP